MNKKIVIAVMGGALAAGLVCLIVGLIVYFTAKGNVVSLLVGLFTIATGTVMACAAAIVLLITLIIYFISKSKNNQK